LERLLVKTAVDWCYG